MNTYFYDRSYYRSCSPPPSPPPSQTSRIYEHLVQLDKELANFVPENANTTFVMAIHTCRLAVKGLKTFF